MRVKAFSLIEIIVVIVLIGTIFSLVLTVYTSKKNKNLELSVKDISLHVGGYATLYLYGKDCEKAIVELKDGFYSASSNFGYKKEYVIIKQNALGLFRKIDFKRYRIEKKNEDICFKLDFKKRKFFEKFIISMPNKHYLFSPLYQEVHEYNSLVDAKNAFEDASLYPRSIDDYYHE